MYKVFVNERPLTLTNKLSDTGNGQYYPLNEDTIQTAIKALKKKKLSEAYIYHPNHEEILKKFTKKIPLTVAAGGVVTNPKGKVLFIYRNDKWDLPKGKLDKGESIEDCAIREVMEETGAEVTIESLLGVYLWIHPQTRQQFLRIVYIAHLLRENVSDQLDDGIHAVHWMDMDDILHRRRDLRTPTVTRCIEDYVAGKRLSSAILAGSMPITQRVADVLANAALV